VQRFRGRRWRARLRIVGQGETSHPRLHHVTVPRSHDPPCVAQRPNYTALP
jgi:hypothetical protein